MDLIACYREAWRGFSRWWIPLCGLALVWLVANQVPQMMASSAVDRAGLERDVQQLLEAVKDKDERRIQRLTASVQRRFQPAQEALLRVLPAATLVAVPLTVLLLVWGMKAGSRDGLDVKGDTAMAGRRGFAVLMSQLLAMALVAMPLVLGYALYIGVARGLIAAGVANIALIVGLGLIWLLVLVPLGFISGFAFYILFFFAPQLAADESLGPLAALRRSSRLVRLSPLAVGVLVCFNIGLQLVAAITIIGLIPVTAFVNTARGVAYYQLLRIEAERAGVESEALAAARQRLEAEREARRGDDAPSPSEPEPSAKPGDQTGVA